MALLVGRVESSREWGWKTCGGNIMVGSGNQIKGYTLSSGNEKSLKDFIRGRPGSDLCFRKSTRQCGRWTEGQKVPLTADGLVRRAHSKLGYSSKWG